MAKRPDRPPATVAEQVDAELVKCALEKRRGGRKLTAAELSAVRRRERGLEEERRWAYYATLPKKHYLEMSGRQARTVNEQARRYGLPVLGKTIDLGSLLHWLHDFLADNSRLLAAGDEDDALMTGVDSPALERYREAKARREWLAYERDLDQWIRRDDFRAGLRRFSTIMREGIEQLQRKCGDDAHAIIDRTLTKAVHALADHFSEPTDDAEHVKLP